MAYVQQESCYSEVVVTVEESVQKMGYLHNSIISGAVHDALTLARQCPTGMIFVPRKNYLSLNPGEFTLPNDLEAGANVLLNSVLKVTTLNKIFPECLPPYLKNGFRLYESTTVTQFSIVVCNIVPLWK